MWWKFSTYDVKQQQNIIKCIVMTGGKHTHTHTNKSFSHEQSKLNVRVAFSQRSAPSLQNQISLIIFVRNCRCLCMNSIKTNTRKPQRDRWMMQRELRLWDSSHRMFYREDKISLTVTEIRKQTLKCSFCLQII